MFLLTCVHVYCTRIFGGHFSKGINFLRNFCFRRNPYLFVFPPTYIDNKSLETHTVRVKWIFFPLFLYLNSISGGEFTAIKISKNKGAPAFTNSETHYSPLLSHRNQKGDFRENCSIRPLGVKF